MGEGLAGFGRGLGRGLDLGLGTPLLKRYRDPPAKHRNSCKNRTFRESV